MSLPKNIRHMHHLFTAAATPQDGALVVTVSGGLAASGRVVDDVCPEWQFS